MPDTLDAVWTHAWARLLAGARGRADPFHQGVLASISATGPQARYVVLRAVSPDEGRVAFHTDARSPKVAELRADPRIAWTFFGHGEQLRLAGTVALHADDGAADAAWAALRRLSRRTYAVPRAPGTPVATPEEAGLPGLQAPVDEATLAAARANFVLARVRVEALDWLSLASAGHRRAAFLRTAGGWQGDWRAP